MLGVGGPEERRTQAQAGTAIAGGFVLLVLLAVGLTRMIDGRAATEAVAEPTHRAASARTSPATVPPRQPATTGSSTGTGESISPAPALAPAPAPARIIDTGTGKEVLVPGGTTRAGGTATTVPRTGTTGNPTTGTSPPTTEDTTTTEATTPTTEATTPTTEVPTPTTEVPTPTTEVPTPTTEVPTTAPPPP